MKRHAAITALLLTGLMIGSFTSTHQPDGSIVNSGLTSIPDTLFANQSISIVSFNLPIIPPSSGVQFFRNGIIFLESSKSRDKMLTDHISFGTTRTQFAELRESVLTNHSPFISTTDFRYPSEAITFNHDYSLMYFTRYDNTDGFQKIYGARYSQEEWTVDSDPLSFCNDNATYSHAALSLDGKIMVFSSNRNGTLGGMDLFVTLEKNGIWSEPVNLGNAVNSPYNEAYPHLDADNNLYFSSDNRQGYGGYDIYVCKFHDNTWEKPMNIAAPINTYEDDVAFTIDRNEGRTAFYTIKENGGRSSVQLYKIDMAKSTQADTMDLFQYLTRPENTQMVIIAYEPAIQATGRTSSSIFSRRPVSRGAEDNIVYRVQFLTSFNPKTRPEITVEDNTYQVFEYLYAGAYRLCIGEFPTIAEAMELQKKLMETDYPNASVVVFRNDVITFDPELLKEEAAADVRPEAVVKQPADTVKTKTEVKTETKKVEPEKVVIPKTEAVKAVIPKTEEKKVVPVKETEAAKTAAKKDEVVYRVQILAEPKAKGSYDLKVNNITYKTYEYFYVGSYRTCIGEFATLAPAVVLQNTARKAGYSQAFVVAFKNNVRSTDPALFK